ncbi:MAG: C40 family peptidase [Bacteroidota bacterium]
MSKTGIVLLFGLCTIALLNQRCSNLRFYSSTSTTPSPTRTTSTSPSKSDNRKPTKADYGLEKGERLRTEIVSYAKQHLGVNYKYGGNTPRGFDCSGFTSHVMGEFNIQLNRSSRDQAKQGKKIRLKDAKAGDLVFFSKGGRVFHVAIIASNKNGQVKIVHSTSSRGVVLDNLTNSSYWFPKIHTVKDVSGIL